MKIDFITYKGALVVLLFYRKATELTTEDSMDDISGGSQVGF